MFTVWRGAKDGAWGSVIWFTAVHMAWHDWVRYWTKMIHRTPRLLPSQSIPKQSYRDLSLSGVAGKSQHRLRPGSHLLASS